MYDVICSVMLIKTTPCFRTVYRLGMQRTLVLIICTLTCYQLEGKGTLTVVSALPDAPSTPRRSLLRTISPSTVKVLQRHIREHGWSYISIACAELSLERTICKPLIIPFAIQGDSAEHRTTCPAGSNHARSSQSTRARSSDSFSSQSASVPPAKNDTEQYSLMPCMIVCHIVFRSHPR